MGFRASPPCGRSLLANDGFRPPRPPSSSSMDPFFVSTRSSCIRGAARTNTYTDGSHPTHSSTPQARPTILIARTCAAIWIVPRRFTWSSFYAPSFREPFYIALTKPFLALAGEEVGILIQSWFFSCATLLLFFLIARRLHGPCWAAALLVPIALHEWLILEAPTGYRMSAYAFFLLAATAAMLFTSASRRAAGLAGTAFGLLVLIRLSSLSVAVPLLGAKLLSFERGERGERGERRERHDRRVYAALFLAVLTALVAPFLLSNAVAHGDPFYPISFHTQFWLRAEGLPTSDGAPITWSRYFTDFGRTGAVLKGTCLGMTVLPVKTFWRGLGHFPLVNLADARSRSHGPRAQLQGT